MTPRLIKSEMSDSANLSKLILHQLMILNQVYFAFILEAMKCLKPLDTKRYWNGVYTRRLSRGARLQGTPSCIIWCFKPINSSTQFQFNLHTSRQIKIMKPSRTNGSRFNLDIIPLELN
ncbi:hypothetical protein CFP56_032286 [Quercus suber]|uniref:Uncharacterized protein n=1 Tax=Quercus suber TaxID=58331 RepID=A0AAW0LVB7_QUESU